MFPPWGLNPLAVGIVGALYFAFWVWMLAHCYQFEPDREFWFWVILIIWPAAVVYFFARWLPGSNASAGGGGFKAFGRGGELRRLEIAAKQIGNAHQFIQWGDGLREAGRMPEAADAYAQALKKDADSLPALWGAALANMALGQLSEARTQLEQVLATDPQYKFGDVSLALGECLAKQGERATAIEHMQKHVARWRHPQALFVLASLHYEQGNFREAKAQAEAMLVDIDSSPGSYAKKHSTWRRKGRKLLKQLGGG